MPRLQAKLFDSDGDTHRFYAVLLLIAGATCFGYALGRQTGDVAATERLDERLRQAATVVVEQNAKLEASGAFDGGAPDDASSNASSGPCDAELAAGPGR